MFELRHEVFYDKLGWEVNSLDGLEIDIFDTKQDPVYVVSQGYDGEVYGCGRILPTTGTYMLGEVFPELLRGEKLPHSPFVWELSRLAVSPALGVGRENPQASMCACTFDLLCRGFRFGEENGIQQYVFVTSVAMERMLQRAGLKMTRFGDGKAVKFGKVLSVACRMDISVENRRVLFPDTLTVERAA
jgi:acyl homoserine lactone synthase